MAITQIEYFYEGQQRRFLEQIVKAFSGFQYKTGIRNGIEPQLRVVPCRMANRNAMVAQLMRNGSENTLLACPLITVDQTALAPRRAEMQNPSHVDTQLVNERAVDATTGRYTGEPGNTYTVRRLMPRPFEMTVQVDIWVSNQDQKYQLSEQILMIVFPDFQIQNSESAIDWSARTLMTLDDVSWTSRTVPIGQDTEIEVMSLTFKLPFWLSPPAEVTQQKIVQQIVTNISEGSDAESLSTRRAQVITTPGNHRVLVDAREGTITLLGPKSNPTDEAGNAYRWADLLAQYGEVTPAQSKLSIRRSDDLDDDSEVIGTFQFDAHDPSRLLWQIDPDTLARNTLVPVSAVIDPLRVYPGHGLPTAAEGTRYLLLSDLGSSQAWPGTTARENDIIRYHNGAWQVDFAAKQTTGVHHMINTSSGTQLRWTGSEWNLAVGGDYGPGYWRLLL